MSPLNSSLKTAGGRNSMADDPLATIGNMAESAILEGNRNLIKQNLLNLALNHPTDVLTISKVWYVYNSNTKDWEFSAPDIEVQFKLKVELEEQKSVNGGSKSALSVITASLGASRQDSDRYIQEISFSFPATK